MKEKLYVSSASVKIMSVKDCVKVKRLSALLNERITFQICVTGDVGAKIKIKTVSELPLTAYKVVDKKSRQDFMPKKDDYYLTSKDGFFPELLQETDEAEIGEKGFATFFFEAESDRAGVFPITVFAGEKKAVLSVKVANVPLEETDLMITHWFHADGICGYYHVKPFSTEFYGYFEKFLDSFVKMGNTMLLIPLFTPPLDTGVGKERMTVQTVKVEKKDGEYAFDFTETEKYIKTARKYGVRYFEFSHLFTQWGGEYCPKIIASENGEEKRIFGWDVKADDESYLSFLDAFLPKLVEFTKNTRIYENSLIHLTDEPNEKSIGQYEKLSEFVRKRIDGLKIIDALSHYDFVKKGVVDMPAVALNSPDFAQFDTQDKMVYYCVGVDDNYITNRYLTMPLLRTEALGVQLYETHAKGFLHWGYNYYNDQLTDICLDPYEDLSSNKKLPEGDCFLVYPGKEKVEYSIRYFAMSRAFEDYRLVKTFENKYGKERTENLLQKFGFDGVHTYPKDVKTYLKFRKEIRKKIVK